MAKKKEEEEIKTDGWMATFSDLMNLLLCFFVLLFSMSSVDQEKYEQLVASMSGDFSILSGGAQAIGEGKLVSSGASQLNELDEYINDLGKAAEETDEADNREAEYEEQKQKELKDKADEIYSEVAKNAEKKNIEDSIELSQSPDNQYVMLTLSGGILFDSGSADIKDEAKQLISRVGDILKIYDRHTIEILGHTDSVPIKNSQFESNIWLSTARATRVFEYLIDKKKMSAETMKASGRGEHEPIATNETAKGRAKNRRVEIRIYTNID